MSERPERIWRCDCGGDHFVSVSHHVWGDGEQAAWFQVEDYVENVGHWARLRACWNLLRTRRHTWHTVLLNERIIGEIIDELNAHRGGRGDADA